MWNVAGLSSVSLTDATVWGLIAVHDLIICTETHGSLRRPTCDNPLPGYTLLHLDRDQRSGRGGVAIYIATPLAPGFEVVQKSILPRGCEILWIRLKPEWANAGGNSMLIGACYFSPATSNVHRRDTQASNADVASEVFSSLQVQLAVLKRDNEHVLLAGDFNARLSSSELGVQDVPDATFHELVQQLGATFGILEPTCQVPRARPCEDAHTNEFGHALGNVCRSEGLCVLNGRVPGDLGGSYTFPHVLGGSTIDLFVASSGLYHRSVFMKVWDMQYTHLGAPIGDHKPVTLVLSLNIQEPNGPALPQPRRRRGLKFDVGKWQQYASYFSEDDSTALASLKGVSADLASRSINSTQAVDAIGQVLSGVLKKAFGCGRQEAGRSSEHAPWWSQDCAEARLLMIRELDAVRGRPRDSAGWAAFREARTAYNRVRLAARAAFEHKQLSEFITSCRHNPRALWQKLLGVMPPCPIDDPTGWRSHFEGLYNHDQHAECDKHRLLSRSIFNFINGLHLFAPTEQLLDSETVKRRRQIADEILNIPITLEEVEVAVGKMANNKALGPEKAPAECFRYARRSREGQDGRKSEFNVLVPILHTLVEHIRCTGDLPEQFMVSNLTPVFKRKGDEMEKGNYRGIAVGGALAKCYATILERRIARFCDAAEDAKHRCQAGFRQGYGTSHHLLSVRHFTSKHMRAGQPPLVVCQIDFEKAFDKVPRWLMWQRLEERGISGSMLGSLKACYQKVLLRVKANGQLGEAFASEQGVKQGCPLSTDLFGFYIEIFAEYVDAWDRLTVQRNPQAHIQSPRARGAPVPSCLYADDLTLMATSVERMQYLLDRLKEFCAAFGMRVNMTKCETLVYAGDGHMRTQLRLAATTLSYDGHPIPLVDRARYLGLHYGPDTPFGSCRRELVDSGRKALYKLLKSLDEQHVNAPGIMVQCFEVQIRSILSYGAEVWGPDALMDMFDGPPRNPRRQAGQAIPRTRRPPTNASLFDRALFDPMVELQTLFLKRVVGASLPTHRLLYAETSQLPLQFFWAQLVFGFWNRIVRQPKSLANAVLQEDIHVAAEGNFAGDSWTAKVLKICDRLGYNWRQGQPAAGTTREGRPAALAGWLIRRELPSGELLDLLWHRFMSDWDSPRLLGDPRAFVSDRLQPGVKMCRYKHWMGYTASRDHKHGVGHVGIYIPRRQHVALMRFRLGCWDLEANRPAIGGSHRPREQRVCRMCNAGAVEDEQHVLLECVAYAELRSATQLPADSMISIMLDFNPSKLAYLLYAIQSHRATSLA